MLTQGSIVTAIRSNKYHDFPCYGVIISARCDIANKKIEKIYYLEALELKKWIFSNVCFFTTMSKRTKTLINALKKFCEENNLVWDVVKNFSSEEFNKVVDSEIKGKRIVPFKDSFQEYKKYTNDELTIEQKKEIYDHNINSLCTLVSEIVAGKYMHFTYIPKSGLTSDFPNGIVVDLQELDYFDFETSIDLEQCNIDDKNLSLSAEKRNEYSKKFILDKDPGYSVELCKIESPWIEYLMQRFSNAFIRIGVDFPSKDETKDMINVILNEVKI